MINTDAIQKLNKGEWGEPYAALRILEEGKLYSADVNGQKNPNEWVELIELIRNETKNRIVSYGYDANRTNVTISVNGLMISKVPVQDFLNAANRLFNEIQFGRGAAFSVSEEMMDFFEAFQMLHLKARSIDKSDIFISFKDVGTGIVKNRVGFSIKAAFGMNPTLFNTAKASGAVYRINGADDELMKKVNSICDDKGHALVVERCKKLKEEGYSAEFESFAYAKHAGCNAFQVNLDTLNPRLIRVIERLLWNHFFENEKEIDIPKVMERIINENICKVANPKAAYKKMMQDFLYAAYGGLTASTVWDGNLQANGGLIHVSKNGEVVAYHAKDSQEFRSYLYNNCYLEFPSTGENHGDYGKVYKRGNDYFFNLNFQIRYKV